MFKNKLLLLLSALALVLFTACDDNDTQEETPQASVVILHASEDAPKVDVKVNDDTVLEGVDFTQGSGLLKLDNA